MLDDDSAMAELKLRVAKFTADRDWEQFHDLKNLSMAISTEAAELMDHFRWVPNTEANSTLDAPDVRAAVEHEVADVLLLLVDFANAAGIDLLAAADEKLKLNEQRYPVEKAKGNALKYDQLATESRD